MTLSERIAEDVSTVFLRTDDFAVSASYTPSGGSPRSITVVVVEQPSETSENGEHRVAHRVIHVTTANDDTTGVDDPQDGDTLTISGSVYAFVGVQSSDPAAWTLKYESTEILDVGNLNKYRF